MILGRLDREVDGLPEESQQLCLNALTHHSRWLGTVVFARLRDRHAVDEVMQETALAAARNHHPLDDEGMSKWLYRVALRQALLYRRKQGRQVQRLQRLASSQPAAPNGRDESSAPERLVVASEQRELVQAALQRLGRGDCEILLLKYTENWSCREIAERLGVSEGAIKSRLLRARNGLRDELLRLNKNWEMP